MRRAFVTQSELGLPLFLFEAKRPVMIFAPGMLDLSALKIRTGVSIL